MRKSDEIELSYLAGYFDGEGCIHVSKLGARVISIKSCYPKVVQKFHKIYGGRSAKALGWTSTAADPLTRLSN